MTPAPIPEAKARLRRRLYARRKAIPPCRRRHAARRLAASAPELAFLLMRLGAPRRAAFYRPIGHEIDPRPLMRRMHDYGVVCLIPAPGLPPPHPPCHSARALWRSFSPASAQTTRHALPRLVFTPLVGFDRSGFRLGQGGGWYDRLLQGPARMLAIGLAFACQEAARLPRAPHDRPLAGILTERGLRCFTHPAWQYLQSGCRHFDTGLRHFDTGFRHFDIGLRHFDIGLRRGRAV